MRDCLYATSLPFLLAVVDKAEWRLDVYTTFLRLLAYWSNPDAAVRLVPGDKDGRAFPADGSTIVFLGKPIASVLLADLEAEAIKVETREGLSRVVNHWARWEQRHLDWRDDGVPFVACPGQYETGVPFSTAYGDIDFLTVPDPGRLPAVGNNFARTLTAVHGYYGQLLDHAHGLSDDARAAWPSGPTASAPGQSERVRGVGCATRPRPRHPRVGQGDGEPGPTVGTRPRRGPGPLRRLPREPRSVHRLRGVHRELPGRGHREQLPGGGLLLPDVLRHRGGRVDRDQAVPEEAGRPACRRRTRLPGRRSLAPEGGCGGETKG